MRTVARIIFVGIFAGWVSITPDFIHQHGWWDWFVASGFTSVALGMAVAGGYLLGSVSVLEDKK